MGLRSACGSRVEIGDQDVRRVVAEVSPAPEALSQLLGLGGHCRALQVLYRGTRPSVSFQVPHVKHMYWDEQRICQLQIGKLAVFCFRLFNFSKAGTIHEPKTCQFHLWH